MSKTLVPSEVASEPSNGDDEINFKPSKINDH